MDKGWLKEIMLNIISKVIEIEDIGWPADLIY